MEKAKIIFESYNNAVEKVYDDFLQKDKGEDFLKLGEQKVNSLVDDELKIWESSSIPQLDNRTPEEFFGEIKSVGEAIEVFKLGAVVCDRGIPRPLLTKMESFGESTVLELLKLSRDKELVDDDEGINISLAAIRTLGRLKASEAVKPLLDILYSLSEENENLVEEINDALVEMGKPIIEPVVQLINSLDRIEYLDEYVLNALVRVGKDNRSDSIFRCLKNAFTKMDDKLLGALCLGDYGDGRAIPALRGFIEKNRASIDKPTFMEIAAAIKKLGGKIDDLVKGTAF